MGILTAGQYFGDVSSRRGTTRVMVSRLEHRHGRRLPIHVHRQAFFSMTLAGDYREEAGRRSIEYDALTIVYHPPETAHIDEIGPDGARFLMIEADDDIVAGDDMPDKLRSGYPVELPRDASWIALRAMTEKSDPESIAFELLALACDGDRLAPGRPAWLDPLLDRARDEFLSPPGVRELARSAGVHPVHLARVIRRETGLSIAEIVRRRRVEHAVRRLASQESLTSIAFHCGFADQPHFNRSFRRETGMTPGEMRRLLQA